MPYHIGEKGSHDCNGYPVVVDATGKVVGCHNSLEKAKKQLAALHINVPENNKSVLHLDGINNPTKEKAMADIDNAYTYAQIIKREKQEDGTLLVYGKATDDSLDIDSQICDNAWLERAMPEWFKSGGNIREQHSNIAAGVAKELDVKEDGFYIRAHVVDPVSVKKVENDVLKGFSIGIRGPRIVRDNKAANGRIIDGQIVEISLVDRPANPNAKLMLAKSDGTEIVQVEEMIENETETPVEVTETPVEETVEAPVETPAEEVVEAPAEVVADDEEEKKKDEEEVATETPAEEAEVVADENVDKANAIVDKAKTIAGNLVKFDAGVYENARAALAQLIAIEAKEMEEGRDERWSLGCLVRAVENLMAWYEGEKAEGEVMELEGQAMELSASSDKSALGEDVVEDILTKAVKSATDVFAKEIDALTTANKAANETINDLESKLATALSKAVAGGPKRAAAKPTSNDEVNAYIMKALDYRNRAARETDKTLAQGYRELAEDFDAKAKALNTK